MGRNEADAMTSTTSLLGAAGEHYIVSELLRRGHIAALAPQGVPNTDIVVTDLTGHRLCTIQVKSRRDKGRDGGWHMGPKHEELVSKNLFYCFVDFGRSVTDRPSVFIVPSAVVAEVIKASHKAWLATPGARGQKRKDSSVRRLLPDYSPAYKPNPTPYPAGWLDVYRDAWDLLGMGPAPAQEKPTPKGRPVLQQE